MAHLQHNKTNPIAGGTGLASNIHTTATISDSLTGEFRFTTDTCKTWVFCGTDNQRVHGNDMIVCHEDEVISYNNEVVWLEKIRTSTYQYA